MAHKRAVSDPSRPPLKMRKLSRTQPEFEIMHKLDPSPACPGIVKTRPEGKLAKLPSGCDAFSAFAKIRADKDLTDEEAFLELLKTYDISLLLLSRVSVMKLEASFSNVTYEQIAPYVWLNPGAEGDDMCDLEVHCSRIPKQMFYKITCDVDDALKQYGTLDKHDNEEARSRFVMALFKEIVCTFDSTVVNKPEGILDSQITKRGRIEHHFTAVKSISIIFVEFKKIFALGKNLLDTKAQVLAECATCDYANLKAGHWVPILAISCDGNNFEYLVYDSSDKLVYTSGCIPGVTSKQKQNEMDLLFTVKQTTEYLFDFFLMAYINGIRAFGDRSMKLSQTKKRLSTEKWMDALALAEKAHWLLREAAIAAKDGKLEEAEKMAEDGLTELKSSVSELPAQHTYGTTLSSVWDGSSCVEAAFVKEASSHLNL